MSRQRHPATRSKSRSRTRSKSRQKLGFCKPKSATRSKSRGGRPRRGGNDTPELPFGLQEYITRVYSKYSTLDMSVLDELRKNFLKATANMGDGPEGKYPLQIFHIDPDGVRYESEKKSDRNEMNFTLFKGAHQWAKSRGLPIPTTTMYLWVSDTHPYYLTDIDKKFPILSYCSPANMDYILFPDESFACLQVNQKYKGECKNFDQVKQLIADHIPETKIDQIYFKGVPTTDRQSRLREDLARISLQGHPATRAAFDGKCEGHPATRAKSPAKSPGAAGCPRKTPSRKTRAAALPRMAVLLDAWSVYEPLYEWSKYKWLLNLPGRYPWSNRLRWLFLMKSGVINVDVQTVGRGYTDYAYMSFINLIVKPGVDFINIDTVYNNKIRPGANPSQADLDAQYAENTRVYHEILDRTAATSDAEYNRMVTSGFNKVNALTSEIVSQYIYHLIVEHASRCPLQGHPATRADT